jgi:hypothetical protein
MRRIICTTVVVLITITSANAEFAGMGTGLESCGTFAKNYQVSPQTFESIYFSWAQGFLTGVNAIAAAKQDGTNRDLSSIPVNQQQQFLRDYCNKHPLAEYMEGVVALYLKFKLSTAQEKK